tara:strand:+ start:11362 stop:11592 length:231 start_codon:yes stop_codon:yes gene_type:complete
MPNKLKPYKKSDYKDHDRVLVWIYRKKSHTDYETYFEFKKVYKDTIYSLCRYGGWKIYDDPKSIWGDQDLTGTPMV